MQKKIVTLALFAILLLSIAGALTVTTRAATEEELEQAIETGVAWLATKQNPDGSWGTDNQPAKTGFAVLKFETHAIRQGIDPLDPGYEYYGQVKGGLDYLFLTASTVSIGVQPAGDPDTDGDGIGVRWYDSTYHTGISMMAIAASTHPEMTVNVVGSAVNGWTYKAVVQDTVDYLAWGQTDTGGSYRGGWNYDHMDNSQWGADNSNSGYAVLGLAYAEAGTIDGKTGFGCTVPEFVRSELNFWIDYIQNDVGIGDPTHDGGSGYTNPDSWVNTLKTGNLLFEMAFYGDDNTVQRVIDAVDYIDRHWNDPDYIGWKGPGPGGDPTWPACYQAMYCIMKGFEVLNVKYISPLNDPSGIDWYEDFANALLAQQNPDGSWPNAPFFGAPDGQPYSPPGGWAWDTDQIISTEWALLTLQKTAPPLQLSVSISPTTAKIKIGESVTFTSSVSGGTPPYSYQWYLNGAAVSGAIFPTWTFAPVSTGTYTVYLNVTDSVLKTAKSNVASVTVAPPLTVSISPTSAIISVGQSVTFTSTVSGGYPPYSYQWYLDGAPVSGATSSSWTFTPTTSGIYYVYLKVTDANNNIAQSETARTMVEVLSVGGYSISLAKQTPTAHIPAYTTLITLFATAMSLTKRKRK